MTSNSKDVDVERIRVSCEAPAEKVGLILAFLARLDITDVQYDLVTDVLRYKNNSDRPKEDSRKPRAKQNQSKIGGPKFLAEWVKDHPNFKVSEAIAYFEKNGRTRGSAYSSVSTLAQDQTIKSVSPGQYKAGKSAKPTKPGKPVPKKAQKTMGRYDVSNYDLIVQYARKHGGKFTLGNIKTLFDANHRPASSGSPAIRTMVLKDMVRHGPGAGEYALREKAMLPAPAEGNVSDTEVLANG